MMRRTKLLLPLSLGLLALLIMFFWETVYRAARLPLRKVLGHYEGCLDCHADLTGFSPSHTPESIGCSACHLGDPLRADKDEAHEGMVLVPGNLSVAQQTCGTAECHPRIVTNMQNSLMATGRGLVTVDRFVFGEQATPDGEGHLSSLGHSPADRHLRQLCASCHLALEKRAPAAIGQRSRGGGCTACHIHYTEEAKADLRRYREDGATPIHHPSLTVRVTDEHCFGCHSRSGRISTNYSGWHETLLEELPADAGSDYRELEDGRVFVRQRADVHHQKGLECIDCHTWRETMGTGEAFAHQEDQVEIRCQDCHRVEPARTVTWNDLDEIDRKILRLRDREDEERRFVVTLTTGRPLLNLLVDREGRPRLIGKNSDRQHPLKPPADICTRAIRGHERLSCKSCHTAWAPQCITCHTEFDPNETGFDHLENRRVQGAWVEYAGDFLAEAPVLGVRRDRGREIVDTFIPGMILTITLPKPLAEPRRRAERRFQRLYAPTAPHTTMADGRECTSCHNNPLAMGFGRGELKYTKRSAGRGRWTFTPEYAAHPADGLPYDAWTGFLRTRSDVASTRVGARPFDFEEQKKILRVGACLTCHPASEQNISRIYSDFGKALDRLSPDCLLPAWE